METIQIRVKKTDYNRLAKYGVAGEAIHTALTRVLDEAEGKHEN